MEPGNMKMEELRERIDALEYMVRDSEGDIDRNVDLWDQLKHLRTIYDQMIRDSQGRGVQMMGDIMQKNPVSQRNYVAGVPVADSEMPPGHPGRADEGGGESPSAPAEGSAPQPNINLTINVDKSQETDMPKSLDERTTDLIEKSDISQVGQGISYCKGGKPKKGKKDKDSEDAIDGIDVQKINKMNKRMKKDKKDDEEEDKDQAAEKEQEEKPGLFRKSEFDSWARSQESSLEKGRMKEVASSEIKPMVPKSGSEKVDSWVDGLMSQYGSLIKSLDTLLSEVVSKVGVSALEPLGDYTKFARSMAWAIDAIRHRDFQKSLVISTLGETLEKCDSLVSGMSPAKKTSSISKIRAIFAEIEKVKAKLSDGSMTDEAGKVFENLRVLHERLAVALMASEGLGLKTEDLIAEKPAGEMGDKYSFESPHNPIKKSLEDSIELRKGMYYKAWKEGDVSYVLSAWDSEGAFRIDKNLAQEAVVSGKKHEPKGKVPVAKGKDAQRIHVREVKPRFPGAQDDTTEDSVKRRLMVKLPANQNRYFKRRPVSHYLSASGGSSTKSRPKGPYIGRGASRSNKGRHLGETQGFGGHKGKGHSK